MADRQITLPLSIENALIPKRRDHHLATNRSEQMPDSGNALRHHSAMYLLYFLFRHPINSQIFMSLCLSMIVKNEAHIIQRCLRSVKPIIDSYSISDTGSTDNTMDLIREEMAGIPGILTSDPWEDFGTNRNLSLSRCTGDYAIRLDADETIRCTTGSLSLPLEFDGFLVQVEQFNLSMWQTRIVRNDSKWTWKERTHEYLTYDGNPKLQQLNNLFISSLDDSSRRQTGQKLVNDLYLLETGEMTPRNVFYLAGTLWDLQRIEEAEAKYYERVALGGWEEEVYYSLWRAAECKRRLARPFHETAGALFAAYMYRPTRHEALASLCNLLGQNQRWEESYRISLVDPRPPKDTLFINTNAEWQILEEHAVAAYYIGKKDEARDYFLRVMTQYQLSPTDMERLNRNLSFCK